jgi:hypothetical protein
VSVATYRFLPWVRAGAAGLIDVPDTRDSNVASRARLPVAVEVNGANVAEVTVRLFGPGEVTGIDTRQIVRTEPTRNATDFEPTYFPAVEFDRPDFPWLFTPAAPNADRIRPWLVLVTVRVQDGVSIGHPVGSPLPVLEIAPPAAATVELPDLDQSWAWAHAQVIGSGTVEAILTESPVRNLSRLLSPRRLDPNVDYLACLVPAFAAGVAVGLGQLPVVADEDPLAPAWVTPAPASIRLPVYHSFEFATGDGGDFEQLVRRLEPRPVPPGVGTRRTYIGRAGAALPAIAPTDPAAVVGVEGPLQPPGLVRQAPSGPVADEFRRRLVALLDAPQGAVATGSAPLGEAPVGAPIWGGRHAGVTRVAPLGVPRWLRELNNDARDRIAAGLGANVVRVHQEDLVHQAWEQVGDVLAANRVLEVARAARALAQRLHTEHVARLGGERLLHVAQPALSRTTRGGRTIASEIGTSSFPAAAVSAPYRRMLRPRGPIGRRVGRPAAGGRMIGIDPSHIASRLGRGEVALADPQFLPDGLATGRGLGSADDPRRNLPGVPGTRPVPAPLVAQLRGHSPPDPGAGKLLDGARWATSVRSRPSVTIVRVGDVLGGITVARPGVVRPGVVVPPIPRVVEGPGRLPGSLAPPPIPSGSVVGVQPPPIVTLPPLRHDAGQVFVAAASERFAQLAAFGRRPQAISPRFDIDGVQAQLSSLLEPTVSLQARALARVELPPPLRAGRDDEPLGPVMASPTYPRAAFELLRSVARDVAVPGLSRLAPNSITLLETNPRFVEAFLIGMNHELMSELRWREYPTDQRGTPFRRFWNRLDGLDDIVPIDAWSPDAALGRSAVGEGRNQLVLALRGDLLRRFPGAIIYVQHARWEGRGRAMSESPPDPDSTTPDELRLPILWARLEPDITFIGFDIDIAEARGADGPPGDPGWFFIIEEQPTEPRFGLDAPRGRTAPPSHVDDVSWDHVPVVPGGPAYADLATSLIPAGHEFSGGARWAQDAAHFAEILLQRPVRVGVHARELVAGR